VIDQFLEIAVAKLKKSAPGDRSAAISDTDSHIDAPRPRLLRDKMQMAPRARGLGTPKGRARDRCAVFRLRIWAGRAIYSNVAAELDDKQIASPDPVRAAALARFGLSGVMRRWAPRFGGAGEVIRRGPAAWSQF
jgi:hypothetical protein